MKMMFTAAAMFAAATAAAPALAQDASGGHYEWQTRQVPGPNKSGITQRVRVWVKDDPAKTASCDCAMMHDKAKAADCMAGEHKAHAPSMG